MFSNQNNALLSLLSQCSSFVIWNCGALDFREANVQQSPYKNIVSWGILFRRNETVCLKRPSLVK